MPPQLPSRGGRLSSGDPSVDILVSAVGADFHGTWAAHARSWLTFGEGLRLIIQILGAPIILIVVLVSTGSVEFGDRVDDLPFLVGGVALVAAILTALALAVLIQYRLDTILYARALNALRRDYVAISESDASLPSLKPYLPLDPSKPDWFEPLQPMGILVILIGLIDSAYLAFGILVIGWLPTGFSWAVAGLFFVGQYLMYTYFGTRRGHMLAPKTQ